MKRLISMVFTVAIVAANDCTSVIASTEHDIVALVDATKYAEALKLCEKVKRSDPVWVNAQILKMHCLRGLDRYTDIPAVLNTLKPVKLVDRQILEYNWFGVETNSRLGHYAAELPYIDALLHVDTKQHAKLIIAKIDTLLYMGDKEKALPLTRDTELKTSEQHAAVESFMHYGYYDDALRIADFYESDKNLSQAEREQFESQRMNIFAMQNKNDVLQKYVRRVTADPHYSESYKKHASRFLVFVRGKQQVDLRWELFSRDQYSFHCFDLAYKADIDGEMEKAIALMFEALSAEHWRERYYFARAEKYLHAHELPEAIADLKQALKLCPTFTAAWAKLARAYGQSGDRTHELIALDKAVDTDTKGEQWGQRAEFHMEDHQYQKALVDLKKCDMRNYKEALNAALASAHLKQRAEAVRYLSIAEPLCHMETKHVEFLKTKILVNRMFGDESAAKRAEAEIQSVEGSMFDNAPFRMEKSDKPN